MSRAGRKPMTTVEIIENLRDELFAICEDTENRYADVARNIDEQIGAFARGRRTEAKSIRNAMGEVFREAARTHGLEAAE